MTEQDTENTTVTRKPVAEHEYLDAAGNVVDDEESAQGYRYKLLENGETFAWQYAEATEDEKRLLALFGAKTLATNESSAKRNSVKGAKSADEQIEAVRVRFNRIRNEGVWVDRSGAPGFAVKPELLAQAINNVKERMGKTVDIGETMRRIAEEAGYVAKARKLPDVAAEYAKLAGRPTVSIDDI